MPRPGALEPDVLQRVQSRGLRGRQHPATSIPVRCTEGPVRADTDDVGRVNVASAATRAG